MRRRIAPFLTVPRKLVEYLSPQVISLTEKLLDLMDAFVFRVARRKNAISLLDAALEGLVTAVDCVRVKRLVGLALAALKVLHGDIDMRLDRSQAICVRALRQFTKFSIEDRAYIHSSRYRTLTLVKLKVKRSTCNRPLSVVA